jgi:hypothetical protein
MDIEIVTSFNKDGYIKYGKEFLRTFDQFWPKDIKLTLHISNDGADFLEGTDDLRRVDEVWFLDDNEELATFKKTYAEAQFHGMTSPKDYTIRYDAVKFSNKSFAILDSLKATDSDIVFWLDADTITHSPVTHDDIKIWIGDQLHGDEQVYTRYLGREQNPKPLYSECGFVMYRPGHQKHNLFVNAWRNHYTSGSIFTLSEWHDSFVYDSVRKVVLTPDEYKSWTSGMDNATTHPFIQVFGPWMDHRKGPRKETRSGAHELRVPLQQEYWKQ